MILQGLFSALRKGTKSLYQSFQNSLSVSYFQIPQEPLNQNS